MAVSELENDYPGAFGSNGGKSRALSIASTFWTLGTCVGPLLAGYLVEQVGYFNMNCVVGEYSLIFCRLIRDNGNTN